MRILSPILLTLMTVGTAHSGDWPQWLGPNRDGSTDEKIAPWKQAPQAAWRVKVGEGHSSPVIAGGRVFLHTKVADKAQEQLTAYNLRGTNLWTKK